MTKLEELKAAHDAAYAAWAANDAAYKAADARAYAAWDAAWDAHEAELNKPKENFDD